MINLYHTDCMEFMKGVPDKHYDLAIVDPPYGIKQNSFMVKSRTKLAKTTDWGNFDWDSEPPAEQYFTELIRVSKNQIVFGANHFISKLSLDSSCWIVWDKDNGDSHYADCELAWTSFDTTVRKIKIRWNGMLQHDMKSKEDRIHPTQKPVKLYKWLLKNYAKEGDKIFDSHLGSGSIAIACHDLKFSLDGCEIDKDYYEAAVKRFNNHKQQLTLY